MLLSNTGNKKAAPNQTDGNPPHTVLSCMEVAKLGERWAHVCTEPAVACAGVEVVLGGKTDSCTCRDDKPEICFGSEGGEPVVFALQASAQAGGATTM